MRREATSIVLLDGRSGAGKTVLAAALEAALGGSGAGVDIVHMDDLYAGWRGLRAGAELAVEGILRPLAAGEGAVWRAWDWAASAYGDVRRRDPGGTLILEGCGAITRASAPLSRARIWLELDERARRSRAAARDGDDSWWDEWAAQESALLAREGSPRLANLVLEMGEGEADARALAAFVRQASAIA